MRFEKKTRVVFRAWHDGSGVLALFPRHPGTNDPRTCSSYEHFGQHGTADPLGCVGMSRPARPEEYQGLKEELERIGYKLLVKQRITQRDLEVRKGHLEDD